jgi:tripartite-type tricarboxylate transporter receptor subunit TctC
MRPLSKKLNEILGQPIVLDSKPGANGNIGAQFTSKANPDGYTLLVGNSSIPISVSLYRNLGYDPLKDLTMISLITMAPSTLVTNTTYPVKTVSDLIKLAKENPGKINYGSAGSGSTPHLGMEMLGLATGTKFTHIPYKGAGPAVTALLGGEVDVLITNTSTILSQVQAKRLNPIAVTSAQRSPIMPNIPTISETVPNFEIKTWYGLFGPANLPKEVINKLNAAVAEAVRSPEIKEQLIRSGYEPETTTPDGFNQLMKEDIVAWGKAVKASGVQID